MPIMRFLSAGIFSPHSAWSRSPGESLEAQPAPETVWVSFIVSKSFIIFIKFFGLYYLKHGEWFAVECPDLYIYILFNNPKINVLKFNFFIIAID
jgi:hypothetical protein